MRRGKLITIEGIDGAGKTSQIAPLTGFLDQNGIEAAVYREPGSTVLGEALRGMLKSGPGQSPLAEILMFAAARAELVTTRVNPDLAAGRWVVLDRFTDSTMAYQGALGIVSDDMLQCVCQVATGGLKPDLTLWLDVPPEIAAMRTTYDPARMQMAEVGELPLDAIEQRSAGYHEQVRRRYSAICQAEPERVRRIDAEQDAQSVTRDLLAAVREHLDSWLAEEQG